MLRKIIKIDEEKCVGCGLAHTFGGNLLLIHTEGDQGGLHSLCAADGELQVVFLRAYVIGVDTDFEDALAGLEQLCHNLQLAHGAGGELELIECEEESQ